MWKLYACAIQLCLGTRDALLLQFLSCSQRETEGYVAFIVSIPVLRQLLLDHFPVEVCHYFFFFPDRLATEVGRASVTHNIGSSLAFGGDGL
jgi:hypothetical protein